MYENRNNLDLTIRPPPYKNVTDILQRCTCRRSDNGDFLCQNVDFFEFTLTERIYDYSTMEIVAPYSQDYINLKIEAYSIVDNVRKEVSLSFALENGEWYLDSPTY